MSDGKRLAIYGRSGVGKTALMNQILANRSRVILFDYLPTRKAWAEKMGYVQATSIEQLRDLVLSSYGSGFKIWFRPPMGDQARALHALSEWILKLQATRQNDGEVIPIITLAIDELSESYPVSKLPSDMQGFTRLCKAGRHFRINLIGATQRPAQVSTEFRGNVDSRAFLSLQEPADLRAVEETAGKATAAIVSKIYPYVYLHFENGRLSEGQTVAY